MQDIITRSLPSLDFLLAITQSHKFAIQSLVIGWYAYIIRLEKSYIKAMSDYSVIS